MTQLSEASTFPVATGTVGWLWAELLEDVAIVVHLHRGSRCEMLYKWRFAFDEKMVICLVDVYWKNGVLLGVRDQMCGARRGKRHRVCSGT